MSFKDQLNTDINSVFINENEFAEEIIIKPANSDPDYVYSGIFDSAYELVNIDTEADISSINPVVQVKENDLPQQIVQEDIISIRGVDYIVTDTQSDGVGIMLIILNLV